MKYAHYNSDTGEIIGFYDDEVHEVIPSPNKQLTDEEWNDAISNRKKIVDDNIVDDPIELTYIDKRTSEYPPIQEYVDAIVKNDQQQLQAYIDACLAVKTKYPKE